MTQFTPSVEEAAIASAYDAQVARLFAQMFDSVQGGDDLAAAGDRFAEGLSNLREVRERALFAVPCPRPGARAFGRNA